ncbi:MAG: TRAP transporter small permease subunit [Paracoccus sp. (in: a-proteobacteria)]|nr:TRAP transporter small permease subunit [Paracoccus sp. (in: a-proteobacteria)]
MRAVLDRLYGFALFLSCAAMAVIALLVLVQVAGRVIDRAVMWTGGARIGIAVPSLAEIAGALFVASAALALPATLREARHVRVTFASRLGGTAGRGLMLVMLLLALGFSLFASWHTIQLALDSWQYGSVSYGRIKIPLFLPQSVMAAGFSLLSVAIIDEIVSAIREGAPSFRRVEESRGADEIHE